MKSDGQENIGRFYTYDAAVTLRFDKVKKERKNERKKKKKTKRKNNNKQKSKAPQWMLSKV